MNEFEKQFSELRSFLSFGDYAILTRRIIDFTLDTEDVAHYKKTAAFLDWLDAHEGDHPQKAQKYQDILNGLYATLSSKKFADQVLLVSAEAIIKEYASGHFRLGPADLTLRQGDILGLVGENGNGKTTLLRLLCGELVPSKGNLRYHFSHTDRFDLRTKLVYIPQRTETWYGSMIENLQFTAASYGYTPEENELVVLLTLSRFGLRKFRDLEWKNLSSGYKMRFELARMLLRKPAILLVDEPLANLDILAQQTILEDFRAIAKSPFRPIGIVLSSQQLYEVEKASDEVIFLKNGSQKNLRGAASDVIETEPSSLVIEFESIWKQERLAEAFSVKGLAALQYNGGTYIATFPSPVTLHDFLRIITENRIPVTYLRDISMSTRRFFLS